jgi:hypothetical protein
LNTLHRAVIALAFLVPAQVGGAQEVVDIKQFAFNLPQNSVWLTALPFVARLI